MISVVLAVHNEAKNLARCLDSVKDFADEIVLVDGESTDDTVKIAKKYKAKIISTTNKANFHINKQLAMDAAKGDLVLQLDADEVVDAELSRFVKKLQSKIQAPEFENEDFPKAWWLKRKNLFLGHWLKKGGQYPDPVIRLYLAGFAKLPQKDVHEQMEVQGEVAWAKGHLLHYSNPSFADYLEKFNRYTDFKAAQLATTKEQISLSNSLLFFVLKPLEIFFSLFFRHRGYVDGFPGFIFALFSALHYPIAYIKLWEKKETP